MDQRQSVLVRRLAGAGVLLLLAFGISLILPDPSTPPGAEEGMARVELRIADGGVVDPAPQAADPGKAQEAGDSASGASTSSSSLDMAASSEIDTPAPADDEPPAEAPVEAPAPTPAVAVVPEPKPKPATPPAVAVVPPKPKSVPVPPVAAVVAEKKPVDVAPAKPAVPVTPPPEVASKPDIAAPVVSVPPAVVPSPASKPATPAAPATWQIQAGSYADIGNARQVEDQLKALGYAATLSIVEAGGSARYRVRCGPFASRELAEAARKRLEQNRIPASLVAQGG